MPQLRHETLTWNDVDKLIDHLLPQFEGDFEIMVIITRGGIVPGGLLAEATGIPTVLTAAVDFPAEVERQKTGLFAWPRFLEFPNDELLDG
jgi:hypoxanthine phosphoribosyltransferase